MIYLIILMYPETCRKSPPPLFFSLMYDVCIFLFEAGKTKGWKGGRLFGFIGLVVRITFLTSPFFMGEGGGENNIFNFSFFYGGGRGG